MYGSIHLTQTYQTHIILNMIPRMENSRANPTPAVKPLPAKNERSQVGKITLIAYQ